MTFDESGDRNRSWDSVVSGGANGGALRAALLFGAVAVAFGLAITPFFDQTPENLAANRQSPQQLDDLATGSVKRSGKYTIRRSVLQSPGEEACIFDKSGEISGQC